MKITFIFTDKPDIDQVPADDRYKTYFELPNAVKSLPDIQAQIIAISELVGQFTNASLHINCADIGLKNRPIKQVAEPSNPGLGLFFQTRALCLYFTIGSRLNRTLTIYSPLIVSFPLNSPSDKGYRDLRYNGSDQILRGYNERVQALSDRLLKLLNEDGDWQFGGFHPYLIQKRFNKRRRR